MGFAAGKARINAKRDANERDVVDALKSCGVSVWREGPLDLVCRLGSRYFIVEVKNPDAPNPRLTKNEIEFMADAAAFGADVLVINSVSEISRLLNRLKRKWLQR